MYEWFSSKQTQLNPWVLLSLPHTCKLRNFSVKKQVFCFDFEMLLDTAEVLVVLSPASLRASIRGEAGSILPDDGNGMKRWSSCPSSHGVLVAELVGLYLIPLPNPVPWANADHSPPLMLITDSYWIRTGASLFLLCIAGPVKDRVFYSGSSADTSHNSEQRNKEGWTVTSTSLQCRRNWCVSRVASLPILFNSWALPVWPGWSQWAAIPWKSLLLAWDRVAVGSTSLDLPNCLAFSVGWIQVVISCCRRGVSWQSLHADLQARLKVFASTPDSHMKYASLGSLD